MSTWPWVLRLLLCPARGQPQGGLRVRQHWFWSSHTKQTQYFFFFLLFFFSSSVAEKAFPQALIHEVANTEAGAGGDPLAPVQLHPGACPEMHKPGRLWGAAPCPAAGIFSMACFFPFSLCQF